jgi:hypothetical protein
MQCVPQYTAQSTSAKKSVQGVVRWKEAMEISQGRQCPRAAHFSFSPPSHSSVSFSVPLPPEQGVITKYIC